MLHTSLVKMKVYCIILLTCIGQFNCFYQNSQRLETCYITPLVIRPCDDMESTTDFSGALFNLNDAGDKALNFTATVNEVVTDEFKIFVKLDKWTNGAWENDIFNGDGLLWDYVRKFAAKAWKKLREHAIPSVSQEYGVDPGSYELAFFQVKPDDFSIPTSLFGKFRIKMIIQNPEEEVFLCHWMEGQVDRP